MGVFFYNIFLGLFRTLMPLAALFNPKARKWVQGRRDLLRRLELSIGDTEQLIWVHCASLGEFEQGRPVIEGLRQHHPEHKILLTFFSPSGYEVRKDYAGADWVFYLPMDGPRTAKRFLEISKPSLVIFVKYEFWYYYLKKIKYRQVPLLLVSALFWEKMSFFKWYGGLQRKMLSRFDQLFVQNSQSAELMKGIGLSDITRISGDTRFDRVVDIAEKANTLPSIETFIKGRRAIVAGSTWPEDEQLLSEVLSSLGADFVLIIAPHEIDAKHLSDLRQRFPEAFFYSQYETMEAVNSSSQVLIIDSIGLLSRLYQYAYVSYIGGGFGRGIHNTLEAAVYGRPVIFGPVHHKFKEATDLLQNGGANSVNNATECLLFIQSLMADQENYRLRAGNAREYVYGNRGATKIILDYIQEKRLLTS